MDVTPPAPAPERGASAGPAQPAGDPSAGLPPVAREAALRAALCPSFTPRRWRRYLAAGGDPTRLADATPAELGRRLGLGRDDARALVRQLRRADPAAVRRAAVRAGIRIDLPGGSSGPAGGAAGLADLPDPPIALYRRGTLGSGDAQAVAVVGSRRASPYGLRVARALAGDLARAGVTIVGGLARGIDAAAHEGALAAGGRTVAVLGSGLLEPYPPEHVGLLERIARRGAVLSEFPLHAHPTRTSFPQRNRLIAALSLGVVVVEAAERSGALGTVGHALDLGRCVMAVPGPVDRETSRGTLAMLRDGATPVGSAEDVFAAIGWVEARRRALPDDERRVLDALPERGAGAGEVAAACDLRAEVAAGLLVTLEVRGLVRREAGGGYVPV